MMATEIVEELERLINEFGDGHGQIPDQLEHAWCNNVDRVEFDHVTQTYRFISDH
jgi:hypothetical protein